MLCVLAVQALGFWPGSAARLAGDASESVRCADANQDGAAPVDPTSPADSASGHCKLCGYAQPFLAFFAALIASIIATTIPVQLVRRQQSRHNLAPPGFGSSWSPQAPPAF